MPVRVLTRGVTAFEFAQMCKGHLRDAQSSIPIETTLDFLDHCCAIGLMTREHDEHGVTHYAPTAELGRCLPAEEDE